MFNLCNSLSFLCTPFTSHSFYLFVFVFGLCVYIYNIYIYYLCVYVVSLFASMRLFGSSDFFAVFSLVIVSLRVSLTSFVIYFNCFLCISRCCIIGHFCLFSC